MELFWTPKARQTYFKVLNYLEKAWTEKEIHRFIIELGNLLDKIRQNPEMFEESSKRKNVRKGLITKHNTLYFQVRPRKNEIHLLVFWDNRQNPDVIIPGLSEHVKPKMARFPKNLMFQLTEKEVEFMVSHFAIPSKQHFGGSLLYILQSTEYFRWPRY